MSAAPKRPPIRQRGKSVFTRALLDLYRAAGCEVVELAPGVWGIRPKRGKS